MEHHPVLARLLQLTQARLADKSLRDASFALLLQENAQFLQRFPIIKITGTNGKGSVSAMLSACLQADGRCVGLFTSPHLFEVNERIVVQGQAVSDALLLEQAALLLADVEDFVTRHGAQLMPSFFECLVVLALRIFCAHGVQFAIFEASIGGRNCATHLLPSVVSALTSVGLDHMDKLGSSLASIASDKAALASPGTCLVLGPQMHAGGSQADLLPVIEAVCGPARVQVRSAQMPVQVLQMDGRGNHLVLQPGAVPITCRTSLLGAHQVENCMVVLRVLEYLHELGLVADVQVVQAVQQAVWPGRLEWCYGNPNVLLDGAHNAHAFAALAASLDAVLPRAQRLLLYGASQDKDYAACIPLLENLGEQIVLLDDFDKAVPCALLRGHFSQPQKIVAEYALLHEGLQQALRLAAAQDKTLLVLGSLYMVGAVRRLLLPQRIVDAQRGAE